MKRILGICFLLLSATAIYAQIRINEVAVVNLGPLYDEDGDAVDWIEFHNAGSSAVNLNGYLLSDNLNQPQKWTFPSVTVPPNGYLIVFASGKNRSGPELHTNFSISAGEFLTLYHPTTGLIQALQVQEVPIPYTFGREASGNYAIMGTGSPGQPNPSFGNWGIFGKPGFVTAGGYYSSPIQVELHHYDTTAILRYTTDGSEPNENSTVYTGPIPLGYTTGMTNRWSMIPTNPALNFPLGSYDSVRANTRGWVPPYADVFKAHVIRAKAFPIYPGALPSGTVTRTFIIDPLASGRFSFPVLSLVSDSIGMFSPNEGIYVWGNAADGNYNETGDAWERPAHVEMYNEAGDFEFGLDLGIRTHGGGGRHSTQKSLKLNLRNAYGSNQLNHLVFPNKTQDKFNDLILRGPGHRPDCIPRDDVSGLIVTGLDFDYMHSRQVIVLLNGEYWGIHTIKENLNAEYFANKYSIPVEQISLLDKEGDVEEGDTTDEQLYNALENFIHTNDMSIPANYAYVKTQMDIDNYIDYQLAQIYFGNGDWPNSNLRMWRKSIPVLPSAPNGHDGRFRWIFYDLDGGFGGSCNDVFPGMNGFQQATLTTPLFNSYTRIMRGLLNNPEFRERMVIRYCDLLNSWYRENRVSGIIQQTDNLYSNEILEHIERWRYPSMVNTLADRYNEVPNLQAWDRIVYRLDSFATRRPTVQRNQMLAFFSLSDSVRITVNVNDTVMGRVKINSLIIHPQLPGVTGSTYPWRGLYMEGLPNTLTALPLPGYRFVEWMGTGITTPTITFVGGPDTTLTALFEIDPLFESGKSIRFNEVMAINNDVIQDNSGQFDDWMELYNPYSDTIDLQGYFLSTSLLQPTQFQINSGTHPTKIPPGGFHLYWADNDVMQGNNHTNFTLPATGGTVYLFYPDGITLVDSLHYAHSVANASFGRYPDGEDEQVWFHYSTPGMSNQMTSVPEEEKISRRIIPYPNPNQDGQLFLNKVGNYIVFDINGKEMGSYPSTYMIDISTWESGLYLIRDDQGNTARFIRL